MKKSKYIYAEDIDDAIESIDYWQNSPQEAYNFALRSDTLTTKLYEITIELVLGKFIAWLKEEGFKG